MTDSRRYKASPNPCPQCGIRHIMDPALLEERWRSARRDHYNAKMRASLGRDFIDGVDDYLNEDCPQPLRFAVGTLVLDAEGDFWVRQGRGWTVLTSARSCGEAPYVGLPTGRYGPYLLFGKDSRRIPKFTTVQEADAWLEANT